MIGAATVAWLVLVAWDLGRPDRLVLEIRCRSDTLGIVYSGYVRKAPAEPVTHPPQPVFPAPEPTTLRIPLPATGLERVVLRLPRHCTHVDVYEVTVRLAGSLFWPDQVLARVPPFALESMGGIQTRAPTSDSALRFTRAQGIDAKLQIRNAARLLPEAGAGARPHLQRTVTALALGVLWSAAWRRRSRWGRIAGSPAVGVAVLASACALLLHATLAMPPPTVGLDELSYMQAACQIPNLPAPPGYLRIGWELPNLLYAALGHGAFALTLEGDTLVTGIQVLLYVLSGGILWVLADRLATRAWANATAVFVVLSGFRCYVDLFMPETLYAFLFTALAATWCLGFPYRPAAATILAGCLCAALWFVKPHAVALVGAMTFCCLLAPRIIAPPDAPAPATARKSLAAAGLFLLSTGGFALLLSSTLAAMLPMSRAGRDLGDYAVIAGLMTRRDPFSWHLAAHYVSLAAAQLLLAAPYLAIPCVLAVRAWQGGRDAPSNQNARRRLLVLFAASTLLATFAMAVHYTIRVGEDAVLSAAMDGASRFRAHGRYYSFTFPLFFILLAAGFSRNAGAPPHGWRTPLAAAAAAAGAGALLVGWAVPRASLEWYDFPAAYGLTTGAGTGLAVASLLLQAVAVGMPARRFPVRAAACALLLYAGYSAHLAHSAAFEWNFRQRFNAIPGRRFAQIVPAPERASAVLVTSRLTEIPYFIYPFRYAPLIPRIDGASIPNPETLPPDCRWLITCLPMNPEAANHNRISLRSECMDYRLYAVRQPSL